MITNQIQFLPGAEGIKTAYNLALQSDQLDIVCLSDNYQQIIGDFFEKQVAPKIYQPDTRVREILPQSDEDKISDSTNRSAKFIKSIGQNQSDYLLTNDQAVLISFDPKKPYALVVSDPTLVSNLKSQFQALWKSI